MLPKALTPGCDTELGPSSLFSIQQRFTEAHAPDLCVCVCVSMLKKNFFIGLYLLYNVLLVSAVKQTESAIRVYIYPLFFGFPSHSGYHRALGRVP